MEVGRGKEILLQPLVPLSTHPRREISPLMKDTQVPKKTHETANVARGKNTKHHRRVIHFLNLHLLTCDGRGGTSSVTSSILQSHAPNLSRWLLD